MKHTNGENISEISFKLIHSDRLQSLRGYDERSGGIFDD